MTPPREGRQWLDFDSTVKGTYGHQQGAAEFFTETIQRLPAAPGGYVVRADSGFFSGRLLSAIEAGGHDYLVKVKLKNLRRLLSQQDWQSVPEAPEMHYCSFDHACAGWEAIYRKVCTLQL